MAMDLALLRDAAVFIGILLFYAILARGLFIATEPRRRSVLEIADRICQSDQIPEEKKQAVCSLLDDVHSVGSAWRIVFSMVRSLRGGFVGPARRNELMARANEGIPPCFHDDLAKFRKDWMFATLGNSLLASILFAVFALSVTAFFFSFFVYIPAMTTLLAESGRGRNGDVRHRPAH
ncbi:MAG: hypothetical protein FWD68_17705 [Alphaproteobacteria bacterium]|nr:hypothetical protein [Alphaproteobacteria bacterium]